MITGGPTGIALAFAQTLASEGCRIAICGRDKIKPTEVVVSA
jgi:short-subunit dehydrogenase involved in D-alanine esterification of teichoic acids